MADSKREPGRPDPRRATPPTTSGVDPQRASPLGRGVDPGPAADTTPTSRKPGALHGAGVPGERGGSSGTAARASEDVEPRRRRDDR